MNNLPINCTNMVIHAVNNTRSDPQLSEQQKALQLSAIYSLPGYLSYYLDRDMLPSLIEAVCRKKLEYIRGATTKAELKEIMAPPLPRWNAGRVCPASKYQIDEEELMLWAIFSPGISLTYEAYKRYVYLFEIVFGHSVKDFFNGK